MNKPAKAFVSLLLFLFIVNLSFAQPQGKILEQETVMSSFQVRMARIAGFIGEQALQARCILLATVFTNGRASLTLKQAK